ncbi:MAG: glycosyltransferase, partial [Pirellula sp.]
ADAMTELLVEAGIADRSKFVTIYSGMDIEPFLHANQTRDQVRRELGIEPGQVVVGKIARLFHLKGHEFLLATAKRVIQADPRIRFLLVGDGLLRESLSKSIESMGLHKHFIFTGLVPPDRIPALIGAMDIVVHASLREGLARALPQALLAEKPVISYDVDGAREVVLDGKTGFLLPAKAIEPLGDSILKLANEPTLRQSMGQQGKMLCKERFGHQHMTRQIRSLYEQVLSKTKLTR